MDSNPLGMYCVFKTVNYQLRGFDGNSIQETCQVGLKKNLSHFHDSDFF